MGNDLSLNAYTYANNNPVMYVDPTGTDAARTMGFLARFASAAIVLAVKLAPLAASTILIGAAVVVGVLAVVAIGFAVHAVYNHFSSSGDVDEGHSDPSTVSDGKGDVPQATNDKSKESGIVYKRTDRNTGEEYVGQAKNPKRYEERQREHARKNLDADYVFDKLGIAEPGRDLDVLEQKKINELGGLQKEGGKLSNKRQQIRRLKWALYGIE